MKSHRTFPRHVESTFAANPLLTIFVCLLTLCVCAVGAQGAVFNWSGGGSDNNWGTTANWTGLVSPPSTGLDEVRLAGTLRPTPNVNQAWSLADVLYTSLSSTSFTLGGSALSLTSSGAITIQDSAVSPQTINNAISFTNANPVIWPGFGKTLVLGGSLSSNATLFFMGKGSNSTVQITAAGSINAPAVEVSAATASYDNVILKLDHANAIANTATLRITPSADGLKKARVNLNFTGNETVAGLVLNGVSQPAGTYNTTNQPNYFTGTGNILVPSQGTGGVYTWSGGGADNNWGTTANWSGLVSPASTGLDEVRLAGTLRPTPNVNQAWSLADVLYTSLSSTSFTLGGSALSLTSSGAITIQDSAVSPQTINNAIAFTNANPVVWAGFGKTLVLGGSLGSNATLFFMGKGSNSTVQITAAGSINAPAVEVSAATASYDNVILKLDHANAIANTATLRITPSADGLKKARVNLNFTGNETVAGLVLNGVSQPAGTYNTTNQPNYFTGTGNLVFGSGGGSDTQAPSVPTGLQATVVSSSRIDLSWTASADNVGVAGYKVYRGGSQIATVTSGTSYSNTGLTANTTYSYTVAAYDAAGNTSAPSTAVVTTTSPSFPGIVTVGLTENWDASGSGATASTWTSNPPASNTTWQWNTSGVGIVRVTTDPSSTTGIDAAYQFDATTVAIASTTTFNTIGGNATFEFWIKPATLGNGKQVIFETGGTDFGLGLFLDNDDLKFTTKSAGGPSGSPNTILTYKLHHTDAEDFIQVVAVSDTVGGFKLYVNALGETNPDVAKASNATYGNWGQGTQAAGLGGAFGGFGTFTTSGGTPTPYWNASANWLNFRGQIGYMRIYNRPLTATEVKQNFVAIARRDASTATPVTNYAEWGPNWGRSGLGRFYMNADGEASPQPGDIENNQGLFGMGMLEWRAVSAAADGMLDFKDATKFPRVSHTKASVSSYGGAENIHAYVKASDTQSVSAILYVQAQPNLYFMWLNGNAVTAGQPVTLAAGWNRLMIRSCSDATNPNFGFGSFATWKMKVKVGHANGGALSGLQFQIDDPQRKVLVTQNNKNYRYVSSMKRAVDGDQLVFVNGETVSMDYDVWVGLGQGPQYQHPYTSFDDALKSEDRDYDRYELLKGLNWVYSVDPELVAGGNSAWTSVDPGGFWKSSAPASNITRLWDTGAATGVTYVTTPDPSPATAVNSSYRFDGEGMASTSSFSDLGQSATFEMWVKPDALTNGRQVLFETGDYAYGLSVLLENGTVYLATKGTGVITTNPSPIGYTVTGVTDFIQIVAVSDPAAGFKLYVNKVGEAAPGTAKTSTATFGNWTQNTLAAGLGKRNGSIGGLSNGGGANHWGQDTWFGFKGQIGFMRTYNRVLSGTEIAQNFTSIAANTGSVVSTNLVYNWSAATGSTAPIGNWATKAPNRVNFRILNSANQVVYSETAPLSFGAIDANGEIGAGLNLNLPALGVDHYRIYSYLLDADGKVQVRDRAHAFSVVLGPVDQTKDQKPRLMGSYAEWLLSDLGLAGAQSKLRYLNRIGFTKQMGIFGGWSTGWLAEHDGAGNVTVAPSPDLDSLLVTAANLNIEVIGQLVEGYCKEGTVLSTLPSPALPAYGTTAWNNTFKNMAIQVVTRYKNRIKRWGGKNEIDINMIQNDTAAAVHDAAMAQIWAGVQQADPTATYFKSSVVRGNSSTFPNLVAHGYLTYGQGTDVHTHPGIAPDLAWTTLSEASNEGRAMLLSNGYTGECWYGEINSPESRNYWGAIGSAGDLIKQMAWAVNRRDGATPVTGMMYLTAYNGEDNWSYNDGFNNQMGDPLQQVNTANVVSKWIDGRNTITTALTGMPVDVEYLRVDNANLDASYPQAVVLWNDRARHNNLWHNGIKATRSVTLTVSGANVKVVNYLGQETTLAASGGKVTLEVGPMPVIVRGSFN